MSDAEPLAARLRARAEGRSRAVRRVAEYAADNPVAALASSAAEIGATLGLSDASVVRAVQALGFAGLAELRRDLALAIGEAAPQGGRPAPGPAADFRRTVAQIGPDSSRAVDLVLMAHQQAIAALQQPEGRAALLAAIERLHPASRIIVFGIGPSAPLAAYTVLLLARNGRRGLLLDRTGIGLADQLLDLQPGDALLLLAYGRPYREVEAVAGEARRLGLPVVLLTDRSAGTKGPACDTVLSVRRGPAGRVALHGATLVALEAVVLGLSVADPLRAQASLERLSVLREAIGGKVGRIAPPCDTKA